MDVELRMIRQDDRAPGSEAREQTHDSITWWVSAAGISEEGARAFEDCANYLYDRHWDAAAGHLRGRSGITYTLVPDLDCAVHMRFAGGVLDVKLSAAHFARASFNSTVVTLRQQFGLREFAVA